MTTVPSSSYYPLLLMRALLMVLAIIIVLLTTATTTAVVPEVIIISEIADKGTSGVCEGNDWLELYNTDETEPINLTGYILHDDKGMNDATAFVFTSSDVIILEPNEYRLICTLANNNNSPQFKIGGDDTVTLRDPNGQIIHSVGPFPGTDNAFDVTYAWNPVDNQYAYTLTPTPGTANIITTSINDEETESERKIRLQQQNDLGTKFFNMDQLGYPIVVDNDDPLGSHILDLYMSMEEFDYEYLMKNQSYEVYRPFQSIRVVDTNNNNQEEEDLLLSTSRGRIRSKGQSTLYIGTCMGTRTIPFQVEFINTVNNTTQTLFGVEKFYLRTHLGDNSYMRDYASHRMLARFELPYLRARHVRFYINDIWHGLYTLLEAPDQEYVFARNFPNYNPQSYGLFKVKTLSLGCGGYSEEELANAQDRLMEEDTTTPPPYAFERGEHRIRTPVLGPYQFWQCLMNFFTHFISIERPDVVLAYVRSNATTCGDFLVSHGLIDRDLGVRDVEWTMEAFINTYLGSNTCNYDEASSCSDNSDLSEQVDLENFLKNFAVYAVTMNQDSPLGNGNNYYLAYTGDGTGGWKMMPYDHNTAGDATCNPEECNPKLIHWSILRPTCRSLESNQLAGPLLTNPTLHAQYIEYARSFTETVIGNETFMAELEEHARALQADVTKDFWSTRGIFYGLELSPNAGNWDDSGTYPLLPLLQARYDSVMDQLTAIDDGTFPRGPHLEQGVETYETCVDWRTTEPPVSACGTDACNYDGCNMPDWAVPYYCDEASGVCYHAFLDASCEGVDDGARYNGMEDTDDGRPTFCANSEGTPIHVAQCPDRESKKSCGADECNYVGCNLPDWTVPHYCDEETGTCYHGNYDEQCQGVADTEQYGGMENTDDGRSTFCIFFEGMPLSVAECPPRSIETAAPSSAPIPVTPQPTKAPSTTFTPIAEGTPAPTVKASTASSSLVDSLKVSSWLQAMFVLRVCMHALSL